jgi:hypothetical protein
MSAESSKGMKRQWQIVQFLLNGVYVSSKDIQDELARLGTELRTIQRDLVMLEKFFHWNAVVIRRLMGGVGSGFRIHRIPV